VAAKVNTVTVASAAELRREVANYIADGYAVSSQNDEMATLEFRVRYNMPLLIGLLLLCLLPGLVYIFMVGAKAGRQVVIVVDPAAGSGTAPSPASEAALDDVAGDPS
jgi:hypothetical protein